MAVDRRTLLKTLAGSAVAAAATSGTALAVTPRRQPPPEAVGLLYDATRCIGCKACVVACREANDLPADPGPFPDPIYQAPIDLNDQTKNIIKLYKDAETVSYMKVQCMHCVDPSCASACMLGALSKDRLGIVSWEGSRCVGCRYCQMACPFNIPKFEWHARNPRIVKCELCRHLLAKGGIPACARACPRQAVIFGKRDDLLADAKKRIADNPGRYVPRVYGETDGGGTQVLYLSAVPFEKLGLPDLGDAPGPAASRTIQHGIYKGFIAPAALYAILGAVVFRNRRHGGAGAVHEEERP